MKNISKKSYGFLFIFLIGFWIMPLATSWVWSNTQFTNEGVGCLSDVSSASWIEWITLGGIVNNRTLERVFNASGNVGNCSRYLNITGLVCCPENYECNRISGICEVRIMDPCEALTTRNDCEAYTTEGEEFMQFAFSDQPGEFERLCKFTSELWRNATGAFCTNISKCGCTWQDNTCKGYYTNPPIRHCVQGQNHAVVPGEKCVISSVSENKCETIGKIIVRYSASPVGCSVPTPKEYPCSAVVVVPFFTTKNFILSLLGIISIYFLFGKKTV